MHSMKFKLDLVICIVTLSNLDYGAFGKKNSKCPNLLRLLSLSIVLSRTTEQTFLKFNIEAFFFLKHVETCQVWLKSDNNSRKFNIVACRPVAR
jgi:hypothetical protein